MWRCKGADFSLLKLLKHRIFILALQLFCCFSALHLVSSCTKRQDSDPQTFILGISNEIKNLDLRSSRDKNVFKVAELVTQALLKFNEKGELVPDLATKFHHDNFKTFHFSFSKKIHFHTGTLLKMSDIAFSFKDANKKGAYLSPWLKLVKNYSYTSNSFTITLKNPSPAFYYRVIPLIKVLPEKEASLPSFEKKPIGTGPYFFSQRRGRDLIFLKNPYYTKKLFYNRIIFRSISDENLRYLSLVSGSIDALINNLEKRKIPLLKKDPRVRVFSQKGMKLFYLACHLQKAPFNQKEFRQWIHSLIPLEDIKKYKLYEQAELSSSIFARHHSFYSNNQFFYDKNKLKTLFSSPPLKRLQIMTSSDKDAVSWLLVMKNEFKKYNIELDIQSYEFSSFYSYISKGQYECFLFRMNTQKDPSFLAPFFHSEEWPPGKNRIFYKNKNVDQLLEQGLITSNLKERKKIYSKMEKILLEDFAIIPLWHENNVIYTHSRVYNFKWTKNWLDLLETKKRHTPR